MVLSIIHMGQFMTAMEMKSEKTRWMKMEKSNHILCMNLMKMEIGRITGHSMLLEQKAMKFITEH